MKPPGEKLPSSWKTRRMRHAPFSIGSLQWRQRAWLVGERSAPSMRGSRARSSVARAVRSSDSRSGTSIDEAGNASRSASGRLYAAQAGWNQWVTSPSPNGLGSASPKRSSPFAMGWRQPRHLERPEAACSKTWGTCLSSYLASRVSYLVSRVPLLREHVHRARHAVAPEGDTLREHRRLDAGEAPEDHRGVEIAQVPDAEGLPREGAEAAGEGDLEALACDRAKRLHVDAVAHLDRGDGGRARLRHAAMQSHRPPGRPALGRRLDGAREQGMPREDGFEPLALDQRERRFQPVEQHLGRRAAELGVALRSAALLPVPVVAWGGVARGHRGGALVHRDEREARGRHEPLLRGAG